SWLGGWRGFGTCGPPRPASPGLAARSPGLAARQGQARDESPPRPALSVGGSYAQRTRTRAESRPRAPLSRIAPTRATREPVVRRAALPQPEPKSQRGQRRQTLVVGSRE